MRVYNLNGRRDNKYKARIKILIHETGFDSFVDAVESEFKAISLSENRDLAQIDPEVLYHIEQYFQQPDFMPDHEGMGDFEKRVGVDKDFQAWVKQNLAEHRRSNYKIVTISLKPIGGIPETHLRSRCALLLI